MGLAVRKYVMMKRGAIASDAQRKPGSALTARGREEVDYLLARLAARIPAEHFGLYLAGRPAILRP